VVKPSVGDTAVKGRARVEIILSGLMAIQPNLDMRDRGQGHAKEEGRGGSWSNKHMAMENPGFCLVWY